MYTRENFEKIKSLIDKRRSDARALSEARSLEMRALSPEVAKIDDELRKVGLLIFKTACDGGDIAPVRERNQALVARRKRVIAELGFPENYTDVQYTCKECGDTGYVDTRMCSCFRSLLLTENIKSSGMGKLIEKQNFDNFRFDIYDSPEVAEAMRTSLAVVRDFADNFGKNTDKNFLFIGNTGTGKTHISSAVARRVIEKGYDVLYDSVQNIISAFETDTFRRGPESLSAKFLECDLLIVDDLGTEFSTQFTVSCIYNLINTRYNRGLSTIISTNLDPVQLSKQYDDRIYSRLVGNNCTPILFRGTDYRMK